MNVREGHASYEDVADEYYDSTRHPTCANFNYLSRLYIARQLTDEWPRGLAVEVGAGDSSIAPIFQSRAATLNGLHITDASAAMLQHSRKWESLGATLRIQDATSLAYDEGSVSLVVASLGDPYNVLSFWRETERILA